MSYGFRATAISFLLLVAALTPALAQVADLEQEIRQRAAQIENQLIAWRRDIHEHPELAFEEIKTGTLVAETLEKIGLEVKRGVARTGVVGSLRGNAGGRSGGGSETGRVIASAAARTGSATSSHMPR